MLLLSLLWLFCVIRVVFDEVSAVSDNTSDMELETKSRSKHISAIVVCEPVSVTSFNAI